MSDSLSTTQRATIWAGADALFRQGSQFVFGIVLARTLQPQAFGLLAVMMLFVAFANVLVDSGLGTALVQREKIDNVTVSTAFWFNLLVATAAAVAIALLAPLIASFYREPVLVPLMWAMAANTWLTGFITVQRAMLARAMDFRTQTLAATFATVIAGGVAIMLALHGLGVWALATQIVLNTTLNALLLWWMHPWRPSLTMSMQRLREMLSFSGFVLLASLLDAFAARFYTVLIGRMQSTRDLGYFNQAASIKDFPQLTLGNLYARLVLPILSRNAGDQVGLRIRMQQAQVTAMAINIPVMLGLLVTAHPLVYLVFGAKWLPSVPILRVLCGIGLLWPMHISNINLMLATGHPKLALRIEVAKKSLLIAVLVLAGHWGMMAIAWALLASSIIGLVFNTVYSARLAGYPLYRQCLDLLPYITLGTAMAVAVWIVDKRLSGIGIAIRLGLDMATGLLIYVGSSHILKLQAYRRVRDLMILALKRSP
ncbi:lipopolysaccharide biosynthesis protein [Oleiagrimonas sp. MCCC 1A03011]|uniref:lipopolysaccharide biosynthesis protein n=1 Tax=Oleiagrimonas sp. MCCC 1A03011 TaxID=1926883 RepID=UPI000DC3E26A|nr:lipopolysaccharide biosynthesis protein [Oleiagrimonas sp. MCCC 1A03011]RAP59382.1 hypothetical protein BTJ49_01575 [Oleiagrimonas sp. MCCC 1A03011]